MPFKEEFKEYYGARAYTIFKRICFLSSITIVLGLITNLIPFSSLFTQQAVVSNYEWFYDQYNSIQAQTANYRALPENAVERQGMLMVLNNNISEYNSKSKQITRALWKAKDLPYQLELITNRRF